MRFPPSCGRAGWPQIRRSPVKHHARKLLRGAPFTQNFSRTCNSLADTRMIGGYGDYEMWIAVIMGSIVVPILIGALLFGANMFPIRTDEPGSPHGGM